MNIFIQSLHSKFNKDIPEACGIAYPPIYSKVLGPASLLNEKPDMDIIDEAIQYYRANLLFKNYDISGKIISNEQFKL